MNVRISVLDEKLQKVFTHSTEIPKMKNLVQIFFRHLKEFKLEESSEYSVHNINETNQAGVESSLSP